MTATRKGHQVGGFRERAEDFVGEHEDQARDAVDRAGQEADERTGGRYGDQIDQGEQRAGDYVAGLGDEENPDESAGDQPAQNERQ